MPFKYDPDTLTLFDLETGASVATIHVPDNGSFEEAHRIGYLMAAAEGMREAISQVCGQNHMNCPGSRRVKAALRAAEPPR